MRALTDNTTISQTVDADGELVKRGRNEASIYSVYFLRSTVLGGKILTEFNAYAQWMKNHIYLDGEEVATQTNVPVGGSQYYALVWQHENPMTGARGESVPQGPYTQTREPDSMGVNVGFEDPYYIPPEEPHDPDLASIYPGLEAGGQCRVEGIRFDCAGAQRLLSGGVATRCPNNDCDPQPILDAHGNGGGFKISTSNGYRVFDGERSEDFNYSDIQFGTAVEAYARHLRKPQDRKKKRGRRRLPISLPQKLGEISEPTSNIRIIDTGGNTALEKNRLKVLRKIEWMVNNGPCAEAFKRAGLPTPFELVNNGKITLSSTEALTSSAYNTVLGQALGAQGGSLPDGIRIDARNAGGPARTLRNDRTGQAIIFFGPDAFEPSYLDEAVPHEFIHGGGQGRTYSLLGWFFGHDLSGFDAKAYAEIMAHCKDH